MQPPPPYRCALYVVIPPQPLAVVSLTHPLRDLSCTLKHTRCKSGVARLIARGRRQHVRGVDDAIARLSSSRWSAECAAEPLLFELAVSGWRPRSSIADAYAEESAPAGGRSSPNVVSLCFCTVRSKQSAYSEYERAGGRKPHDAQRWVRMGTAAQAVPTQGSHRRGAGLRGTRYMWTVR